jgi:16S rRNA (cytidine1402-2'-O)-methyltransferase
MNNIPPALPDPTKISTQQYPIATLYVIATPIGNLADITLRALDCLKIVDAVAAEDTRMAKRLLSHYDLSKPCFAAHQHNEHEAGAAIIKRLQAGERIAFLSDAGTPAISDPGAIVVAAVRAAGFQVMPIPGVSAVTTALSAAGLRQGAFYFQGFLPSKKAQAEAMLKPLVGLSANLVFYEAPHRVLETVSLLAEVFADGPNPKRRIVIARELTKLFESIHISPLTEARAWLEADANRQRGEFVLVVEAPLIEVDALELALPILLRLLGKLPLSEAVDLTAELTHASRKALYARALELKKMANQG